jgi:hypothetical protein
VYEGSFFPTSSPIFVVGGGGDATYSNTGEVDTMEFYSATKKNENFSFSSKWMNWRTSS